MPIKLHAHNNESKIEVAPTDNTIADKRLYILIKEETKNRIAEDANLQQQIDDIVETGAGTIALEEHEDGSIDISLLNTEGEVLSTSTIYLTKKIIKSGVVDYAQSRIVLTCNDDSTIILDIHDIVDAIVAENNRAHAAESALGSRIDEEAQARIQADTALASDINLETVRATGVEAQLQSDIDTEEAARAAADTQLQANIDDEEHERTIADAALSTRISNEVGERASGDEALNQRIDALDMGTVGAAGSYVKTIAQSDGQVSATAQPFDTSITFEATDFNAPTTKAVRDYVNTSGGKIDTISINGVNQPVVNKNVDLPAYPTRVSLGINNVDNTADLDKPVSTATQTELDKKQNVIDSEHKLGSDLVDDSGFNHKFATQAQLDQISTNASNIQSLNSTVSGHITNTSNPHQVTKAQVGLSNVDNTTDLEKPISHAQQAALDAKQDLIDSEHMLDSDLVDDSASDNKFVTASDLVDIAANTSARHTHVNFALLETYAQTEANLADAVSKKHSHDNKAVLDATEAAYTIYDSNKLAGIEPLAQVNILEGVQRNGTDLTPDSNKKVNIIVPTQTSQLTNNGDGTSSFATVNYVDTEIATKQSTIDPSHPLDADLVDDRTSFHKFVDDTGLANIAANTEARHTHSNYNLLETYTQTENSLADAVAKKHEHDNKALLDTYTQTEGDLADAVAKKHSHDNKAVLDATTASYTTQSATKLAGIETGAEVNTIVVVQKNGTDLTPDANRKVNVVVPVNTSDLNNDGDGTSSFATESYVDTGLATKQGSIDDSHPLDADLVDDSESVHKFVTASDLDDIADNTAARHTHTNKALLDTYDQTNADITDAVDKKHAHTNKALLDTYTQTDANLADAVSKKHSHTNKALLDTYTQTENDLADAVSKKHSHANKELLDTYTQTNADIADAVDKKHTHSNKAILDATEEVYTTAKDTKLFGIESGAEVNEIEGIQRNGTDLVPDANRKVNIAVPTKTSDITNDGDGTSNFATEDYVDNSVASKQAIIDANNPLDADLVDDSTSAHKFVTASDLDDIADNTAARHTHSNKALLDTYDQTNSDIADAVTKKHSHSNKALLDTYTQTEANLADAVSKKHSHSNKAVLDATEESYTTAKDTKLSGIESGAEVNVVVGIQKNGTDLTPDANRKVNITVPTKTSDITNDGDGTSSFATVDYVDTKQDAIDSSHKLDADLVDDTTSTHKFVTASEKAQITTNQNDIADLDSTLDSHIANVSNPHSVTKAQVGLGDVVNTGDSATPAQNGTTKFTTGGAYTMQTTLQGNINTVDNKLNYNVHIESGDEMSYNGDTVTKTSGYRNLKTGATGTRSEVIHLANSTTAGMMSPTDYNQIRTNTSRIANLEGQTKRLLYSDKTNPTQQEIQDFVDDYLASIGIPNPQPEDYAGIAVVVAGTYHIWHYYSDAGVGWKDDGADTVSQFTNAISGTILGKVADGFVYAENDGTGSVYGWSALKTRVGNLETADQSIQQDILDLQNNKVDKVTGKDLSTNDFTNAYKEAVDLNTAARHSHANKALLDTYNQTNADLADAVTKKHSHSNKSILDATTASYTTGEATKLSGIETGAEVNTIIGIQRNGSNLTPDANRKVNILVPTKTSDITNDSDFTTNTALTTGLAGKQDVIDANNPLDADLVDDTTSTHKFVTSSDLTNITANTNARHTHSNKALLDTYDQTNADIADAVDKKHSHSNKALLDTYTQTEVNLADAVAKKHSHTNKATLDATTAAFTTAKDTKLSGIETGAEVNDIAVIQKNGTDLTPDANRKVNITVPTKTSDLTNDSDFATNSALNTGLAGKQNTIDASHKLDADLVDDSESTHKFVTATDKSNITANTNARHSHSNKALLDTYNQTNADLTDAVSKKHSHSNKALLDTYDQSNEDISDAVSMKHEHSNLDLLETYDQTNANITDAISKKHSHTNKALLDTYTQTEANLADAVSKKHSHSNKSVLDATTASFTTAKDTKLTGIETGAQVNVIETVKVNGTALTPTSKAVNISVPTKTSDLTNDGPDGTSTYATEDYVDNSVAGKQSTIDSTHPLDADLVDDTTSAHKFVTATDKTNITANTNARHTHSNKSLLDSYDQTNANLADAVSKKHSHSNKALLDSYDQTNANISDAVSKRHSHSNKTILDNTTASFTTAFSTKLTGIETGAQVNILEGVQRNGTDLTPDSNKKVNIIVPTATSDLTNDGDGTSNFATVSYVNDEIAAKQAVIDAEHPLDADLVNDASSAHKFVSAAEKSAIAANTTARHTHTNFNLLETYTQTNADIADAVSKKHSHSNKSLLDTYDQTNANIKDAVTKKHSHSNKTVLDNTTASYTTQASTKLGGIEENAQVNIIEGVKVNGTALTPDSSKAVDITVPTKTSDITNDGEGGTSKFATEDYVDTAVANKQSTIDSSHKLSADLVDDTNTTHKFVTSADKSNITANTNAIHTHSNYALLETYTQTNANLSDAVTKKHSHSNKDVLDATTAAFTTTKNTKLSGIEEGAEVNDIVSISVNDSALTPDANRNVNIDLSVYALEGDLSAVALSGDYADLSGTPTIPTKNSWNYDDRYVRYDATQSLTDTQKAKARSNIGAGTSNFSGDYNDLSNKPTIPVVNNGTLTIQKNGSTVATFTANQSTNVTANITVPTVTDFYWADVKVASSSNKGTTPTFSTMTVGGSGSTAGKATMQYNANEDCIEFVFA